MLIRWAGLFILLFAHTLLAQAEGTVESIGLQGYYRPECWVPMVVQVRPTTDAPVEMQIRVVQEDLDRDRVVAVRRITLSPDVRGRAGEPQRFWMYFRPQPTDNGLQDSSIGGSVRQLEQQLKVMLTDLDGNVIAKLPVTQQGLKRADADRGAAGGRLSDAYWNSKVILCVADGASFPAVREYEGMDGIAEQPLFIVISPRELPEDFRGYEMVDGILWMGAAAPDPRKALEEPRYRAIEEFVRQGGMMVVVQGPESAKLQGFSQLLPVTVGAYRDSSDLRPLLEMGRLAPAATQESEGVSASRRVALARVKNGSVVLREKKWIEKESSPFLVRGSVGAGCVTWVAQDLGEATLVTSLRGGWVRIWDEVFGWRNTPTPRRADADKVVTPYGAPGGVVDVGAAFRSTGGVVRTTASMFVLLAVVFFAGYWVVAGPGAYAYLGVKRLGTLNWFIFGVISVVAALLAVVVVKAVQSGSPRLEHVTLVRAVKGQPSMVRSRVGLYVPSDGMKELTLEQGATGLTNWVTPYPEHPMRMETTARFLAMKQYLMPIDDVARGEPTRVSMPWRSTMKRLQVRWNGEVSGLVDGSPKLTGRIFPDVSGAMFNGTGYDLREVYFVYRSTFAGDGSNTGGDRVIYVPEWKKGETLELEAILTSNRLFRIGRDSNARESTPGRGNIVYGGIELMHRGFGNEVAAGEGWVGAWYGGDLAKRDFGMLNIDDSTSGYQASLPIASLYDRIPPMRNNRSADGKYELQSRHDVARVGARFMNVSPALAAGNMIVLAQARGPLPAPLKVEGDVPSGDGVILYQFIVPMTRPGEMKVESE